MEDIPRINPHWGHTVMGVLEMLLVSVSSVKDFSIAHLRLADLTVLDVPCGLEKPENVDLKLSKTSKSRLDT